MKVFCVFKCGNFVSVEKFILRSCVKYHFNILTDLNLPLVTAFPRWGSDRIITRETKRLPFCDLLIIDGYKFLGPHFKTLVIDFYKADGDKKLPSPGFTLDPLVLWLP